MLRFVLTITVPAKEDPHKLTAATAVAVRPRPDTTGKGTTKLTAVITKTRKGATKSSVETTLPHVPDIVNNRELFKSIKKHHPRW